MSQGSSAYQNNSGEDGLFVFALLVALLGGGLFAAWWFFHTQITTAVIASQHALMVLADQFTNAYTDLDAQVLARDPAQVKPGALWWLLHTVGLFYRVPAAAVVALLAVLCFVGNAPDRFTGDLDLPALMRVQARMFRSSAAYVARSLRPTQVADGAPRPADPALHGREWVARHTVDKDGYNEALAREELTRQLGPAWTGLAGATPHVRAMLAVFALHAARRRDAAMALLGDLASALPDGRADGPAGPLAPLAFDARAIAKADAHLADRALWDPCAEVASRHAFTAPALMSVLTFARERAGVLAPGQFAFLKLIDRRLWYALHALGFPGGQNRAEQPNPRVEAVGARDHWAAECDLGQPLVEPSLDRALAVIAFTAVTLTPATDAATPSNPETIA